MFFKKKINLDGILIAIGKNNENREVSMPYIDDLGLYFVINKNNSYELLNKKDFDSVGMSLDNLKELAIKNTKQKIFKIYQQLPVRKNENDDIIIPFDADQIIERGMYNFWTSLVLIDDFWDKNSDLCIEKNFNNFLIAMPYRTFLIVGNSENEKSIIEMNRLIEEYQNEDKNELLSSGDYEAAKRQISNQIYLMKDGILQVYNK